LAFKADIDDLRESPALDITQQILEQGIGEVLVVEPNIKTLPKALAEKGAQLVKLDEALEKANTIVALVDHKEFKKFSANTLSTKVVIDTGGTASKYLSGWHQAR
jgi:UDP-N-acetyl-D-mannosaminuronic acid dehydrogenase